MIALSWVWSSLRVPLVALHHFAIVVAASMGGLVSCGGSHFTTPRDAAIKPSIGTTVVTDARVNASETIRSCSGPSLCREDILAAANPEALADVADACARHGGTFGALRCAREGAAAKCSAGSEYGTVSVFAYDRNADASETIALVSKQCEAFEGAFEKLGQKAGEKAVEGAAGGDVKVDTSSGSVVVTDKKTGTVSTGGDNVKLPANWPASVPIYPGAKLGNATVSGTSKNATFTTTDPPAKVAEFYKKSGLKLESEMNLGALETLNFKNGKGTVTVIIQQAGTTQVTLAIVD